jgi:alpha-glucosidase
VLAWERAFSTDRRVVLVNFTDQPAEVVIQGAWQIEVASDGRGEATLFTGTLGPDSALVLRQAL